jgi:hypothetical protein
MGQGSGAYGRPALVRPGKVVRRLDAVTVTVLAAAILAVVQAVRGR